MPDLVATALRPVLDHLGAGDDLKTSLSELREPLRTLRRQYRGGEPDFSTASARLAYCVGYHPYHAHLALSVLDTFADALRFDGPVLRAVVFGAGPAPELLALATLLTRQTAVQRLEVDLVDREPGWEESRRLTVEGSVPLLWRGELVVRHHVLDLNDVTAAASATELARGRDLVFAQALFTELRIRDHADSFLGRLMEGFGPQSRLLASDFSTRQGFADRLAVVEARPDLRTLRSAAIHCPMPRAPRELSALYTGADGLIERRQAEVESRLYVRPGWSPDTVPQTIEQRDLPDQEQALQQLRDFLHGGVPGVFVLTGHAGTGKTHLIARAAAEAESAGRTVQLVAPTGQAARRLAERTRRTASTVHSALFTSPLRIDRDDEPPQFRFTLREDGAPGRVVFVDESSLVGNEIPADLADADLVFGSGRLLEDLLTVVRADGGQVVFVGDTYQLPPYGETRSAALDPRHFESLGIPCATATLTTVNRQHHESLIAELADQCRKAVDAGSDLPPVAMREGGEVLRLLKPTAPDWLLDEVLAGTAVVVTFRHADARSWNERARRHGGRPAGAPSSGDRLVTVQAARTVGLLNGDELAVVEVLGTHRVVIRGEAVELLMLAMDHVSPGGTSTVFESWVVNDLLLSAPVDEQRRVRKVLWQDFVRRAEASGVKRGTDAFYELLEIDPYVNALRCSYSYARTCHRAQGGEWDHAICDLRGTKAFRQGRPRFGYTALTRARSTAWLLGWPGPVANPDDGFEEFVEFALDHVRQWVSPVEVRQMRDGSVSLRNASPGGDLIVNLFRSLTCFVQKAPAVVAKDEVTRYLNAWGEDWRSLHADAPDPCLDGVLLQIETEFERLGMDLHACRAAENQVHLILWAGGRRARLRLWHRADGTLTREIANGTDGDAALLQRLRAAVSRVQEVGEG